MDVWSNDACRGYLIAACNEAGLTDAQRAVLADALDYVMEDMTPDEAEAYAIHGEY